MIRLRSVQRASLCNVAKRIINTYCSYTCSRGKLQCLICHQERFQLKHSSQQIITQHHPSLVLFPVISSDFLAAAAAWHIKSSWMDGVNIELFESEALKNALHQKHLCFSTNTMCVLIELDSPTTIFPVGKTMLISCRSWSIWFDTALVALIPTEDIRRSTEEEDLVSDTYTYTKDACRHSNTTSFVVDAFAPPHTIKVPIKGHYGFSTSSNHRESSSTARTLRAHRCLLSCHPKELRLIHKLYDHNYWSKLKWNNNINSEDAIKNFERFR